VCHQYASRLAFTNIIQPCALLFNPIFLSLSIQLLFVVWVEILLALKMAPANGETKSAIWISMRSDSGPTSAKWGKNQIIGVSIGCTLLFIILVLLVERFLLRARRKRASNGSRIGVEAYYPGFQPVRFNRPVLAHESISGLEAYHG
jgi:hypothetical protein